AEFDREPWQRQAEQRGPQERLVAVELPRRAEIERRAEKQDEPDTAADLGYALLLKRYRPDIENATPDDIARAAFSTVPDVPVLFWAFRLMVGC
ncbi:hypothetical protein P8631_16740, partial [Guyparkeria sp. 1SP6A2]|nr:hypothetical protein [Guyparkeria sp. 1SP6A2]